MKHLEIESIELDGVIVTYKIDYDAETVSLIEKQGKNHNDINWVPKQWVFNKREIEYMEGWIKILKAIENAIIFAKGKLADHIEKKQKEKEDLMIAASLKINEKAK